MEPRSATLEADVLQAGQGGGERGDMLETSREKERREGGREVGKEGGRD